MQPAQRNGILLIGLLAAAIWVTRLPANLGLADSANVRLPELPGRIGSWTSHAFDFSKEAGLENYAGSRLGGRRYTHPGGETVDVFLIGTGRFDQFHTPEFCYTSEGFEIVKEDTVLLHVADRAIRAKRMRVQNGSSQQDVLFWFQNGDVTAGHRALIKIAAIGRILEGRRPEPLVLVRFSCVVNKDRSPLDTFVPHVVPYLEPGEVAWGSTARLGARRSAPLD
jgi:EpsI family protein